MARRGAHRAARVRVAVRRREDRPPRELERVRRLHVIRVARIEHAVGKRGAGANREEGAGQALAVRVDVVHSASVAEPTAEGQRQL